MGRSRGQAHLLLIFPSFIMKLFVRVKQLGLFVTGLTIKEFVVRYKLISAYVLDSFYMRRPEGCLHAAARSSDPTRGYSGSLHLHTAIECSTRILS